MSLPIDLHVHLRERGPDGAQALLDELAARPDLLLVALTDHDGIEPAAAGLVRRFPLRLLQGAELTTRDRDGAMIHLLAIGIRRPEPLLAGIDRDQLEGAIWRARAARLATLGYRLDPTPPPVIRHGRHELVARLLADQANRERAALPDDAPASTALFAERMFGVGGAATIERDPGVLDLLPELGATIDRVHAAGALAALAHPGIFPGLAGLPARVRRLVRDYELDAIEAYHPAHDENTRGALVQLAYRLDLLTIGGSDSHGPDRPLGYGAGRPDGSLPERLRERLAFYR